MAATMEEEVQRPQLAQTRPKSKSGFSFHREKIQETAADKQTITGKANPNAAMNEQEPVATALEKPTLASLRSISYNDQHGNLITDPDRSNPTRPRWERPLDTIKSFEAAIENEYRMRTRPDTRSEVGHSGNSYSRRSSSYWGGGYDQARPEPRQRYSNHNQHHGGRDHYGNGHHRQQRPGTGGTFGPRQASDPTLTRWNSQGNGAVYGGPVRQPSRDNLQDSVSAGSVSERWASGTDPTSSENSSVDRIDRVRSGNTPPAVQSSEFAHFGGPIMEDGPYLQSRNNSSYFPPPSTYNYNQGPAPPPKSGARKPIPLGSPYRHNAPSMGGSPPLGETPMMGGAVRPAFPEQPEEKRKSWLRRKFSSRS